MPRFVILAHDHPLLHWDFMLENGATLRTWRLAAEPEANVRIAAEEIQPHRLFYLDYEGPVSGDRGVVTRWDAGIFDGGTQGDEFLLVIHGQRFQGQARLTRDGDGLNWRFECVTRN
jgi:hypothetical protein